jgi:hypothetical protein
MPFIIPAIDWFIATDAEDLSEGCILSGIAVPCAPASVAALRKMVAVTARAVRTTPNSMPLVGMLLHCFMVRLLSMFGLEIAARTRLRFTTRDRYNRQPTTRSAPWCARVG